MTRRIALSLMGAFALSAMGCGKSSDSLMRDMIADVNNLAESIEKKEPKEKQEKIAERLKGLGEQMKQVKMSDDEKKKLQEKYKDDMGKAFSRLMQAQMKVAMEGMGGKGGPMAPPMPNFFEGMAPSAPAKK